MSAVAGVRALPVGRAAPHSLEAAARQWGALAPALAARGQMRLSYDRGRNYPARLQQPLTPAPPRCRAAVHIYDADGRTRVLAADFDLKRAAARGAPDPAGQAAADAAAFSQLIRDCGGRSFADLSPYGGRHGYVIWASPLPHSEMRRIALALAHRYPSFDPAPMLGRDHGIITIPGSRHSSGGIRMLTTPLRHAQDCIARPCGEQVWDRLGAALSADLDAIERGPVPQRAAADKTGAGTEFKLDDSGLPWVPRPAGPIRSLRPDLELTAITGEFDSTVYATPSEARFAVLGSAAARGWQLADVTDRLARGTWPGLAGFYQRYHPGAQRLRALTADWRKAVAGVTGEGNGRACHTRETNHRGGGSPGNPEAVVPGGAYAEIRRWDSAVRAGERYRWRGAHAITIRLVLRALAAAAQMTGRTTVEFGCRSLGLLACLDHSTVARVLSELCAEHDPYLVRLESRRGLRGDLYLLRVPAAYEDAAAWKRWRPGRIGVHPVFRILGGAAALVCEQLTIDTVRVTELPLLTGLAATTVSTALSCLASHGIAVRGPGGWRRGPADLDDVAAGLGLPGILTAILARHRQERQAWRSCLTAVPPPRPPGPDSDEVPWPEAPTQDEYGELVSARAPPGPCGTARAPAGSIHAV